MEKYFREDYSKQCNSSAFSYYDSWQFVAHSCHFLTLFTLPLSIFAGYVILCKTPPRMNRYKWYMMNLHFWISLSDLSFGCLNTGYVFIPSLSGFSVGIFSWLGVDMFLQTCFAVYVVLMFTISMIMLFENRHSALILDSRFVIRKARTRYLFNFLNHLVPFLLTVPCLVTVPKDQEKAKLMILRDILPCPTPEFFYPENFVMMIDYSYVAVIFLIYLFVFHIQIGFFIFHTMVHMREINWKLSNATRRLQKRYFFNTLIQVLVPNVALVFPVSLSLYFIMKKEYHQKLTNVAFVLYSMHGFVSSCVMLFINDPYRKYVNALFWEPKRPGSASTIRVYHREMN